MKNKMIDYDELIRSIGNVVNEKITLKKNISNLNLLELKRAVFPINNLITSKLTEAFIKKLPNLFDNITSAKVNSLLDINGSVNVNGNGYDFRDDELRIVAEVKANIPYAYDKYGSSQKTELKKDIHGLFNGKAKAKISNIHDFYKIMIVLEYENGDYCSRKAVSNLVNNINDVPIEVINDRVFIGSKDIVYILPISLC